MGIFGGGGFFGGGSKETKQTTTTTNIAQDQRVQVGGSAGEVISPGASVGGTGSIAAGPNSTVQQSIMSTGMAPAQVTALLDQVFTHESGLAASLASSMAGTTSGLTSALAATRAPEQSALTSLMPLLLVLGVMYFLTKVK